MTHPLQARVHRNRRLTLLINVRSRRGAALHRAARTGLEAGGWTIDAEYLISDPAGQLPELLPRLAAEQPDLLVVGSGDGTVSHVVHHLAHTSTVLGYLPLGTTNNSGRSLGLPLTLTRALEVINQGIVADIDLGRVDDRYFANLVSIGVSGEVAGRDALRGARIAMMKSSLSVSRRRSKPTGPTCGTGCRCAPPRRHR